jgi:spermidine synthase
LFAPAALNGLVVALLVDRPTARIAALAGALALAALAVVPRSSSASSEPSRAAPSATASSGAVASHWRVLGRVIAQAESPFGTVTVADDARGIPGNRGLFIGQRDMCHSATHGSEALLAGNTLAHLPDRARVLNIGLGCGIVAGLIAASPKVSALEIAEINPVVVQMSRTYFGDANRAVLEQPKTTLFVQDGAEFVRRTPRLYDAIVIDVEEPTVMHSSPLYTREYFEIIRDKLTPGGVLSLWVIGADPSYGKVVWNTLAAVFPHVDARLPEEHPNFNFYASRAPLNLPPGDQRSVSRVRDLVAFTSTEVNTLENRALERHFDIRKVFALPRAYTEPVFKGTDHGAPP